VTDIGEEAKVCFNPTHISSTLTCSSCGLQATPPLKKEKVKEKEKVPDGGELSGSATSIPPHSNATNANGSLQVRRSASKDYSG